MTLNPSVKESHGEPWLLANPSTFQITFQLRSNWKVAVRLQLIDFIDATYCGRIVRNDEVVGSIPTSSTNNRPIHPIVTFS
jgi:hypothetical protein